MKKRIKFLLLLLVTMVLFIMLCLNNNMYAQCRTDTIGRTTFDLQFIGPVHKIIAIDSLFGIHTVWLCSQDTFPFPDLHMRYNFYDFATLTWNWTYGQQVLLLNNKNIPNIDIEYYTHNACISGYRCSTFVAEDILPGTGYFTLHALRDTGYQYPVLSIGSGGYIHVVAVKNESIYYSRSSSGLSWENWRKIGYAHYPSHNICTSKISGKVAIFWTVCDSFASDVGTLYLVESQDTGRTWTQPSPISESIPSNLKNCFIGGSGIYDCDNYLHIVTQVFDGHHPKPVELWHYSSRNNNFWNLIAHITTDTLLGKLGYGSLFACRPSICQNLYVPYWFYVIWEQFRWDDVDSASGEKFLRSDIFFSGSPNYGSAWTSSMNITNSHGINERFPFLIKREPYLQAYLNFVYTVDGSAGIYSKQEGQKSNNPIIYTIKPVSGIEELKNNSNLGINMKIFPNPFSNITYIKFDNTYKNKNLSIYDMKGGFIKDINKHSNVENLFVWNGRDALGRQVGNGVYFCIAKDITDNNISFIGKLVLIK